MSSALDLWSLATERTQEVETSLQFLLRGNTHHLLVSSGLGDGGQVDIQPYCRLSAYTIVRPIIKHHVNIIAGCLTAYDGHPT